MKRVVEFISKYRIVLIVVFVTILVLILGILPGIRFGNRKLQICETPLSVRELRNVKKLITAEYYGEVVADLKEVYIELEQTFAVLKEHTDDSLYRLCFRDSLYCEILKNITGKEDMFSFINEKEWEDICALYRFRSVVGRERKQLVYIGRGWVKAGFDLCDTIVSLTYSESDSVTHLRLGKPVVLYADINPWFSEEAGIEGFEIFTGKNERHIENSEIQAVKHLCKRKLVEDALGKGILEKAGESGISTLERFLKLLGHHRVEVDAGTPEAELDLSGTVF